VSAQHQGNKPYKENAQRARRKQVLMDKKVIFQGAAFAAVVAFIAVIVQAAVQFSMPSGIQVQPGLPLSSGEFLAASTDFPDSALGFFGADTLFVTGYLLVFAGLYALTRETAYPFALMGLIAGMFTGLMDTAENGYFITYALAGRAALSLPDPDFMLPYVLTHLKWAASFVTLFAFGLAFPRRTLLEKVLLVAMLLYPLVGILGIANSPLVAVRGLFFLIGMPLFAIYFWQQSRGT
jgi:hypothetical protein